jgi:hypothetical protein
MIRALITAVFLCVSLNAQQLTPNINLYLPGHNQQQWDVPLNQNFSLLDLFLSGRKALPALLITGPTNLGFGPYATMTQYTPTINNRFTLTDALNQDSCAAGGGSYQVDCEGNGSGWVPVIPIAPAGTGTAGSNPGVVYGINCPGSAIQAIGASSGTMCAASPSGGNGGLYNSGPTTAVAGTGTTQVKYSYSIAGGTLSTVGGIDFYCGLITSGATANFTFAFGSQTPASPISLGTHVLAGMHVHLYNQGATNSQWFVMETTITDLGTGNVTYNNSTANNFSVDTTANQLVQCEVVQSSSGTNGGFGFYLNRSQQ